VAAERAFLGALGGGCDLPVGALAVLDGSTVRMEALVAEPDGSAPRRATDADPDPATLGRRLARRLVETARP